MINFQRTGLRCKQSLMPITADAPTIAAQNRRSSTAGMTQQPTRRSMREKPWFIVARRSYARCRYLTILRFIMRSAPAASEIPAKMDFRQVRGWKGGTCASILYSTNRL